MSGPLDVLSPRGERMIGYLWGPEQSDPSTVAVMRSAADELDQIEDLMLDVREQAWPHKADDSEGLLAIHERMLGLPVKPTGVPVATRQAVAKSAVQSRRVGSGSTWERRLSALLRGAPWSYKRNHPGRGQITITIPFGIGSYSSAQVQQLAERITPAHLEVIMQFGEGWIAGVSRAGDAL